MNAIPPAPPRKRRLRVPLIYGLCSMFVIIMIGYMWIDSIKSDISQLQVTVVDLSINSELLTREYKALAAELDQSDTDEYVIAKARQLYGYMMPNELLFVVKNPEALGSVGETTEFFILEGIQQ